MWIEEYIADAQAALTELQNELSLFRLLRDFLVHETDNRRQRIQRVFGSGGSRSGARAWDELLRRGWIDPSTQGTPLTVEGREAMGE